MNYKFLEANYMKIYKVNKYSIRDNGVDLCIWGKLQLEKQQKEI